MTSLSDLTEELLAQPLPPNARKILDAADKHGWVANGKGTSLCIRLDHPDDPDAVPFFVTWLLVTDTKTGRKSWRFYNAAAANLQSMNFKDVLTYLADPTVIWPEPQEEGTE